MNIRIQVVIIIVLLCVGCKSTSKKIAASSAQAKQTKAILASRNFEIDFNWANPMASSEMNQLAAANLLGIGSSTNRINLIGTTNYLRFMEDSVSVYLPYYGTRQIGAQLGSKGSAITFDGIPKAYEKTYFEEKQRTKFTFDLKEDNEYYTVFMTVFRSGRTVVQINSSQRTSISYEGELKKLEEEI